MNPRYSTAASADGAPLGLAPARQAVGATQRFAEAVDLAHLRPSGDLASTGYAMADPGREYLVLRPDDGDTALTVTLAPGTSTVRWHNVGGGATVDGDLVNIQYPGPVTVDSPFGPSAAAALHLKSG